jgi:hypothetical protein
MESRLQENIAYSSEKPDVIKKISWASIWAGALIGIVVLILLNLLGLGIGFSSLDIQEERNPASGLGIGSGIWYIVSSLVALFVAGWVSGRLAQTRRIFDGALHGILTWCIITLASLYFLTTTIGSIIGGAGRLVSGTLSSVSQGSGKILEMAGPEIKNQLGDMDFSEMKNNGTAEQAIDLLRKADGDPAKVNRNDLANVIMTQTGKTREEAALSADTLLIKYRDAAAKFKVKKEEVIVEAKKTGDDIAAGAAKAFIVAFFAFLVGAIAAGFGAKMGTESKWNTYFDRSRQTDLH